MSTTLDEVIETVRGAREDGPEALAAMALSCGAAAIGGALRVVTLHRLIAELRAAQTAADEMRDALRHERDAARAELKAALESADDARADAARLRALVDAAREERDRAVMERESFGLRASAAERQRYEAWAARDEARARPTYEARASAPTREECAAHLAVGGLWLVSGAPRCEVVQIGGDRAIPAWPQVWIALGADRLPCAWPVVSR